MCLVNQNRSIKHSPQSTRRFFHVIHSINHVTKWKRKKKKRDNNTTFGVFVQFEESALNCTFHDKRILNLKKWVEQNKIRRNEKALLSHPFSILNYLDSSFCLKSNVFTTLTWFWKKMFDYFRKENLKTLTNLWLPCRTWLSIKLWHARYI